MERKHKDWIEDYISLRQNTEPSKLFHRWAAISAISAVLAKKAIFKLGDLKIFPNTYVVLVGPPGSRKTTALNLCADILHTLDTVKLCAEAVTYQKLIQDMAASRTETFRASTNESFVHCSMTIWSGEFESLLGQKIENAKMLNFLTDIYDCPKQWKNTTKGAGSDLIPQPFLSICAATTPHSLANGLPVSAIGGGFTSRIMFVFADTKAGKQPIPTTPKELEPYKESLVDDLSIISHIEGEYAFTEEAKIFWVEWYMAFDETSPHRICLDPQFANWYERKGDYVIKISMILSASESSNLIVEKRHLKNSITFIEEVEASMAKAFTSVGKSEIAEEVELVLKFIREHKILSESKLRFLIYKDVDSKKFDNVINTIVHSRLADRVVKEEKNKMVIYYKVKE
jgi:energy-coupling factor transporter ATP-binding protein EcfA2